MDRITPVRPCDPAGAARDVRRRLRPGRHPPAARHRGDPLLADRRRPAPRAARRLPRRSSGRGSRPSYSHMVAFGAVFVAAAITLSIGIQITYRPAPLFQKYPVLDEIVGGLLGRARGLHHPDRDPPDPRPALQPADRPGARRVRRVHAPARPARPPRTNRSSSTSSATSVIPAILAVLGFLFPQDVRDAF